MQGFITYLKVFYFLLIFVGLVISAFSGVLLGMMGANPQTSTISIFIIIAFFSFLLIFIPTVLMPWLAIKELEKYEINKKLLFNLVSLVISLFSFYLISSGISLSIYAQKFTFLYFFFCTFVLLNFFILYKLKKSKTL